MITCLFNPHVKQALLNKQAIPNASTLSATGIVMLTADRWSTACVFQGPNVLQIQALLTHIKETFLKVRTHFPKGPINFINLLLLTLTLT